MKMEKLKRSGSFSGRVSLGSDENGKRIQRRIKAATKADLQKLADEMIEGKINIQTREMTVKEAMLAYAESRQFIIEPTTLRAYHEITRNRLKSIHEIKIKDLTIFDIQRAVNREAQAGKSRKTIKSGVALLKCSLELFDITLNFKKLQLPKVVKPKEDLPELTDIFHALEGTEIEVYCILALNGCMRISEVLGVKFGDIDTDTQTLHIRRTKIMTENGTAYREYCKTEKSTRTVKLSPELCERIMELPHKSEDEFIVPMSRKALYSRYARIMKKNGLPTQFHKIRKLGASALHAAGMPDCYIMAVGGWSTDNILKSVYEKTFESEREKATQQAADCFRQITMTMNQKKQEN